MALGLVGCSSSTAVVEAEATSATVTPQVQPTKPIAFDPSIGASAKVAKLLNETVAMTAGQRQVPVVPAKEAEYRVQGYIQPKTDPAGTKISCTWHIRDKSGKSVKRIEVVELIEGKKGGDPWKFVDEAVAQRIAEKTADELVAWLPKADGSTPPATASAPQATTVSQASTTNNASTASIDSVSANPPVQRAASQKTATKAASSAATPNTMLASHTDSAMGTSPSVMVKMVTGAPGDGQTSLTNAMKRSLQQQGITLVNAGGTNTYVVSATVQVAEPAEGRQPISIRWLVTSPDGKQTTVKQDNTVQQGSLNGAWGATADAAAAAAAKSVVELLNKPAG